MAKAAKTAQKKDLKASAEAKNWTKESSNVYGGGNAGQNIAKLLNDLPLKFHKTIAY